MCACVHSRAGERCGPIRARPPLIIAATDGTIVQLFKTPIQQRVCAVCPSPSSLSSRAQANGGDQADHDRNTSAAESCLRRRLHDLKERARAETDEAFQAARAEADRLAKAASERSRAANGARLLVVQSAARWIDRAASVEAKASERRLQKRKGRVALRATAMAEFDQTVSEEQRDWLYRVREPGREALTAARLAVADRVEELIRRHRGQGKDEEGGNGGGGGGDSGGGGGSVVTATDCDDFGAQFHPDTSSVVLPLPLGASATGETEEEEEQQLAVSGLEASSVGNTREEEQLPVVVGLDTPSPSRETEEEEEEELLVEGGVAPKLGAPSTPTGDQEVQDNIETTAVTPSTTRDNQDVQGNIETVAAEIEVAAGCNEPGDDVHDDDDTAHVPTLIDDLAPPTPPSLGELQVDSIAPPSPSLDELQVEPFLAAQAAVGASCSADIDAWAEAARSRAQTLSDRLSSEAASDDNEERLAIGTEWKTLELAFGAARKETEEAVAVSWRAVWGGEGINIAEKVERTGGAVRTESDVRGSRSSSSGDFDSSLEKSADDSRKPTAEIVYSLEQVEETSRGCTEETERDGGGGDLESDGAGHLERDGGGGDSERSGGGAFDSSVVPTFAAKEQEQCAWLWASLEQPVASHIRTATTTQHAGIGLLLIEEETELKHVGGEAMARVAELEAELINALADTAATGENGVRAMVAAGREQLRLAFVRGQEEGGNFLSSVRAQEERTHVASGGVQEEQAHLVSEGAQGEHTHFLASVEPQEERALAEHEGGHVQEEENAPTE